MSEQPPKPPSCPDCGEPMEQRQFAETAAAGVLPINEPKYVLAWVCMNPNCPGKQRGNQK